MIMAEQTSNFEFLIPDETNRIINMFDEINETTCKDFFTSLNNIRKSDKNIIIQNNNKLSQYGLNCNDMQFPPINVYLNSIGGDMYSALAMYDLVNGNDDMYCTAMGIVASAAVMFMLAFKPENRRAYANTTFMVHQASLWAVGRCADVEEASNEAKRLNKIAFDIISKNTKITTEQLNKIYKQKKDWYIDANEALKYGIINEII